MKTAILLICAAVLAGCQTAANEVTWNKPGAVEADFVRDRDQCKYETQRATVAMNSGAWQGIGTEIGAAIEKGQRQRELYNSCMTARGYQQQALAAQ